MCGRSDDAAPAPGDSRDPAWDAILVQVLARCVSWPAQFTKTASMLIRVLRDHGRRGCSANSGAPTSPHMDVARLVTSLGQLNDG